MAGEHEEGLDAGDGGGFEVGLQDLAGVGCEGVGGGGLGGEAGWGVFDEAVHTLTSALLQAHPQVHIECVRGGSVWGSIVGNLPYSQRQNSPRHPTLQRPVPNPQQQRRRMMETPFITTSQIGILDLVRQELKRI